MKRIKKQFITAFKGYCEKQHFPEILEHYHEFKTENWNGTRLFIFQWQDGQIERKDTYHFDDKGIILFNSQKRYDFGKSWIQESN